MSTYETIQYELADGVATITLNRPEVFNAFNDAMTTELTAAFKAISRDSEVRAVIITGAGKAFCSGQDLKELESQYVDGFVPVLGDRLRKGYNPMIQRMRDLDKPIVAAINGVAAGAGCSLALAADLRVMATSATLVEVFIHVGLVPDSGSSFFLPRLVGMGMAMEMCMLGGKVTAEDAERMGLTNRVAQDGETLDAAKKLASRLAALPTRGLGLTKRLLNGSFDKALPDQLAAEAFAQETAGKTADHFEGVRAFIEKRKPDFTGR
jgi:2-(1,2-epoxy-1,2-dihydrophenyl)acetyl-CoA isomerase